MTRRGHLLGALALVAWLGLAGVAVAEDGATARAAFTQGERAFLEDDYGLALERFRRAMELEPHDAVRFNVAVCLERLGRFREAYLEYEAAASSPQLDSASLARAREQAARVRERLGRVLVDEPRGAEVFLDGSSIGVVPCEALVDPKAHELELRDGARRVRASIELGRSETKRVRLGFPAASPAASLAASPAPVALRRRVGPGPLTWVGAVTSVAGLASFIGFGLRASALHERYLASPTASTRDEGLLVRDIANVSLVVGLVGALLLTVDLAWLAQRPLSTVGP
jgi:hypothetical protein